MSTKVVRASTADRGPPEGVVAIHTIEQISPNMHRLPNGNLLCMNVPIARIGWLIYGPGETPVKVGENGVAYVQREDYALFNDITMGSFQGAAVTDDHPDDDVTPENWEKLSAGFALNVRRGDDADRDVLLADLMITRKSTIDAILKGKREVSAGYDADYENTVLGSGRQFNIIGNHIALVEKGRCGPRCAIGDSAFQPDSQIPTPQKETAMTTRVKLRGASRQPLAPEAMAALRQRAIDAAAAEFDAAAEEDAGEEGQHIHIHLNDGGKAPAASGKTADAATNDAEARLVGVETKIDALAGAVAKLVKTLDKKGKDEEEEDDGGTKDEEGEGGEEEDDTTTDEEAEAEAEAKKAADKKKGKDKGRDSAALANGYTALMAQAEVLVPGFKVPTFDAAATRQKTVDRMCHARRKVLDMLGMNPDGVALLGAVNGGKPVDTLTLDCASTAVIFKAAAAAKGAMNNARATHDSQRAALPDDQQRQAPKPLTIAQINADAAKFWSGK